jgi:hypothetical protein
MKHTIKKALGLLIIIASLSFTSAQANELKSLKDNPEHLDYIQSGQMCMTVYYNLSLYFAMADELNKMITIEDPRMYLEKSYAHTKLKFEQVRKLIGEKEIELIEQGYHPVEIKQIGFESARYMIQLIQGTASATVQDKSMGKTFILNMIEQTDICDAKFFSAPAEAPAQ